MLNNYCKFIIKRNIKVLLFYQQKLILTYNSKNNSYYFNYNLLCFKCWTSPKLLLALSWVVQQYQLVWIIVPAVAYKGTDLNRSEKYNIKYNELRRWDSYELSLKHFTFALAFNVLLVVSRKVNLISNQPFQTSGNIF